MPRREEVEYIRRHKIYVRVPREVCLRETGKAPVKTGWAETDKGQPGKPNVRARWVAKEYKTHAIPELYASTPPSEVLKVVLSEIATDEREGKVLALVDVRRANLYAPARRKVFVQVPPEHYKPGDEDMCGLLRYSLYGTRDAAQNWEEELASTLSCLGLTRGSACPCVWRGRIKGEDIVATVHGDDITIGGERSAVESLIKMKNKNYEIKKQVIGGDPDLEKSGRILNRVIEWDRDGITIEAGQRHVREIMKGLELERARHSATHESKGENRCGRGQTKYRWNDMNDDDNRDRPLMVDDDATDSQALTGGDVTRHRALVARISYLSQDRPDLKFAAMQVCCAMANPTVRDSERVKRIGRYLAGRPRAKCLFRWQQSGELEAYSDADWGGDKATRRSVSGGETLSQGVDQEAASGIAVFRRE